MAQQDLAHLQARPGWRDPIVIVGAGPVGMSAALGLAHYGVPCIVLDDGDGPAIEVTNSCQKAISMLCYLQISEGGITVR